jgi:hypothetical protein
MNGSQGTAAQRVLWRFRLVPVALVACAGISLSAGDANAGLSPGQSCAAKKLKEAAKVVGTMLKCVEPPVDQGVPPDPCIQAAGARLAEVFSKLEAKGGCIDTNDATAIQENIESLVRKLSVAIPSDPPCALVGQACGSCAGGGLCEPALPSDQNRNVCIDEGAIVGHTCSLTMCASDADCPKGEACFQPPSGATTQGPPVCCTVCTGCNDNDPCTQDLEAGLLCAHIPAPDGTPCDDDGDVCNGQATCQQGACTPGTPLNCNDNNACTLDLCLPFPGCVHDPLPDMMSCDDGNACTTNDHCAGGGLCTGTQTVCEDHNPCTADSCAPTTGACINDTAADDGNPCTTGAGQSGHCDNGVCK